MRTIIAMRNLVLSILASTATLNAQTVLFDFDSAPLHASLPIDQIAGGITAHLNATDLGYSIQPANVLGFTPQGFSGQILYPNSNNLSDLLIRFDQSITEFSIMYTPHELGCDSSATMRVTAYMGGSIVGTNTKQASNPGTWPVDTLRCSFAQGFDSVVVHYDKLPSTCQDYGTNYMADNMRVTPKSVDVPTDAERPAVFALGQSYPNPFNSAAQIEYTVGGVRGQGPGVSNVRLCVYDILGREVAVLVNEQKNPGRYEVSFDARLPGGQATGLSSGVYLYRLTAGGFTQTRTMIVIK